ncbi:MAG: pyridoxal phosphate-dependent aminotransferase [Ignavibacteria bacterium]|nr:pyridoxal phosphate-dependent aminotransferase [Ignavibacteria bacterium]
MFSERLNINLESNLLSSLYEVKKRNNEKIFDLTPSNPTKLNFRYETKDILKNYIGENSLLYEPDPKGLLSARNSVAGYYESIGKKVSAEDIFIVSSTSEAYSFLFKLLLDFEDEILVPQPCYPLFEYLAMLDFAKVVFYPLYYENLTGWRIDFKVFNTLISGKTRAIICINPNNPTGSYINSNDYFSIHEISSKRGIPLIIDEVFSDYIIENENRILKTVVNQKAGLNFILNGFSKLLALPQMKLSWILVEGESDFKKPAKDKLEIISDTYLSVNTPVQHAAPVLFKTRDNIQRQILGRIKENYGVLRSMLLLNPDLKVLKCQGGWNAVLSFENLLIPEEEFAFKLLNDYNVLIHPGFYYDFWTEGFAVISLLTEPDVLEEGISRIIKYLRNL